MAPSCAAPALHDFGKKKKMKPMKLFSGVGHGIKKPKSKKSPKLAKPSKEKQTPVSAKPSIRQLMKDKFDFSRTPYATPKRTRVALNEESCKKRKFFKTTVEIEIPKYKKPKLDEKVVIKAPEFEDLNDTEEEQFAEIKKDVYSILDEWNDDDVHVQPQMTRQKAHELLNETTHLSFSYLTPSSRLPDTPKNMSQFTPTSQPRNNPISHTLDVSTPVQIENLQTELTLGTPIPDPCDKDSPESKLSKLFSIFTSPPAANVLSDVTNKNKKSKASLDKAAAPNDQYQIDAGQKIIGPKECSKCGMVYDIGDPVDEKRHADYHAKRHELKYKSSKTENVVGLCGTDKIVLIKYLEEKKREKVKKILKITEEEIGCGYTWGPVSMAFIYIRNDRILGCLIAEPQVKANRVVRSDGIVLLSNESQFVKCGVNRIWVKQEFRGKKIATEMMNCLRKNFVYGDYLKVEDIAFSSTTPDGHAFARKYSGRSDYLTYEEPSAH